MFSSWNMNMNMAQLSYRRHLLHYTTTEFQYAKRDTRLWIQHIEVLALRSVIFITKISKFLLKCLLTFFSIHNTSIRGALEGERPYWWDCFNCEKKSLLKNSTTKERKDSLTWGFDAAFLPNVFRPWAMFNAEKKLQPSKSCFHQNTKKRS